MICTHQLSCMPLSWHHVESGHAPGFMDILGASPLSVDGHAKHVRPLFPQLQGQRHIRQYQLIKPVIHRLLPRTDDCSHYATVLHSDVERALLHVSLQAECHSQLHILYALVIEQRRLAVVRQYVASNRRVPQAIVVVVVVPKKGTRPLWTSLSMHHSAIRNTIVPFPTCWRALQSRRGDEETSTIQLERPALCTIPSRSQRPIHTIHPNFWACARPLSIPVRRQ